MTAAKFPALAQLDGLRFVVTVDEVASVHREPRRAIYAPLIPGPLPGVRADRCCVALIRHDLRRRLEERRIDAFASRTGIARRAAGSGRAWSRWRL